MKTTIDGNALKLAIIQFDQGNPEPIVVLITNLIDTIVKRLAKKMGDSAELLPSYDEIMNDVLGYITRNHRSILIGDSFARLKKRIEQYILAETLIENAQAPGVDRFFFLPYSSPFYGKLSETIVLKLRKCGVNRPSTEQVRSIMTDLHEKLRMRNAKADTNPVAFLDRVISRMLIDDIRAKSHEPKTCALVEEHPTGEELEKYSNEGYTLAINQDEMQDIYFSTLVTFDPEDLPELISFAAKVSKTVRRAEEIFRYYLQHTDDHGNDNALLEHYALIHDVSPSTVRSQFQRASKILAQCKDAYLKIKQ